MHLRGIGARVVAAVVMIVCLRRDAHADEESDKVREIEGYLGDIKGYLDGIAGDSSYGDIDYALDRASKVKELAERLRSLGPKTDTGKTMANYYPDWVDKFKESARYLKEMKQAQLQQADRRLPEKCKDAQTRLKDEVRRYTDRNDPAGMQKIPELAERAAYDQRDPLKREDETHREMERWYDYARRFSETHGRWSDVKGELHDGANDLWEAWKRKREETQKECGDLVKGKENPVVVEAMKQLAGNDEIRKGLIKEIEVQIKNVYEEIKDIDRRSDDGASEIQDAQRAVDEILSRLDKLKYARGEDEQAKRITDSWPDRVKELRESLNALKKLKAWQHVLDTGPEKCARAEEALDRFLKERREKKDQETNGVELVRERAREEGKEFAAKLKLAEEYDGQMQRFRDDAKRFSFSEGPWSDVRSALHAAAEGTYRYYRDLYEKVRGDRVCGNLAKGERHPDVEKALDELGKSAQQTGSAMTAFDRDAQAWIAKAKAIYLLDCKSMQELWDAYCAEEYEPNEEPEDDAVRSKKNEIIERQRSQIEDLLRELAKLKTTGAELAGKAKWKDEATKLLKLLEVEEGRLTKLQDSKSAWRGNNDPALQFTRAYGVEQHNKWGERCDVYDKPGFPVNGRPDCVVVEGPGQCMVYEFKPKDFRGRNRINEYLTAVKDYYQQKMRSGDDPASELGGRDLMRKIEANCRVDPSKDKKEDRLNFKSDTLFYDRCQRRYECIQ